MNLFILVPLVATIINSFVGMFVFSRSPKSHTNQVYLLFSLSLAIWNFGVLLMFHVSDPKTALLVSRSLHFGVIFLPFFLLHVVFIVLKIPIKKPTYIVYLIPTTLSITNFSDLFIKEVKYSGYSYYGVGGIGFYVFSVFLFLLFIVFFSAVIWKRKSAQDIEKQKINFLIIASFILLFGGLHDTLPVFEIYRYPILNTTIYPLGMIGSIIFSVLLAYSVLQHQILNIYTSLGRIAATCARLFILFMVFFLSLFGIALLFPDSFTYLSLLSSIFIFLATVVLGSILFPKFIGLGEEHIEKKLLGDRFEYQDKIRGFTSQIRYTSSENLLFAELHDTLTQIFEFQGYYLFILDDRSEAFALQQGYPRISGSDRGIPMNSPLVHFINTTKEGFLSPSGKGEFLDLDDLNDGLKKPLQDLPVKLCFLLRSGSDLLGFLMIGQKAGNRPVTNLDLTLLLELSANLGLFINQCRLKKQIARSQEIELLGNVSRGLAHDLNNLITPIFTYCQLSENASASNETLREFSALAKRNLITVQAYIRESLFFSANQEPKLNAVQVPDVLKHLHELHQSVLARRNVNLRFSCPDDLEMTLDEVLVHRLLSNLINNAADASPDGSEIRLTVTELNRSFQKQRWIRFSVEDHGTGIPEDEIEKVFTPYFTTKDTGETRRGSGLGLSIARRIVDLHQGSISISSKFGVGTRVDVDLPAIVLPSPSVSGQEAVQR